MGVTKTQEPQNQVQYDTYVEKGPVQMGPWSTHIFRTDPKHLGFLLSRYKFCAKMLQGKSDVLEVGCGDAFGTPVVLQSVQKVHCIDFEPLVIEDTKTRFGSECIENITFSIHDITVAPMQRKFDAAYSLDVIEHIPYESEDLFMLIIGKSLHRCYCNIMY
ncbi:MAG: class I SAM-dependent methyltransferase [Chloroflexota bacterium]|nr:class I SAM-dependent methyltransferase [Chloroflexota bacterium]